MEGMIILVAFLVFSFYLIFAAGAYVVISMSLKSMYKKANHPDAWMAWIPIMNMFPMMDLIGRKRVEIWLILIPLVGIVLAVLWMMELFRAYGQNPWIVILPLILGIIAYVLTFAAPYSIVAQVVSIISGVAPLIYVVYAIRMGFSIKVQYQGYPKRFY